MRAQGRVLDASAVADDALDPHALRSLLEGSGFLAGRERSFSARRGDIRAVVARVLIFEHPPGAATYLEWVRGHVEDVLGPSDELRRLPTGPVLFRSRPSGCCPKEVPAFLAAWREGARVLWLLVSGPGATRDDLVSLAGRLAAWT